MICRLPTQTRIIMKSQTHRNVYPPPPIKRTPALKRTENIPVMGNERKPNSEKLNDLNEPSLAELEALYGLDLEARNYFTSLGRGRRPHAKENLRPNIKTRPPECCPEEVERLEKEARELDEEERKIRDMKAGRGRGPLQSRRYNGRPPVTIKKEIPHCYALPLSLSSRGALSRPAPCRNFTCCSGIPGFGRGHGQGPSE